MKNLISTHKQYLLLFLLSPRSVIAQSDDDNEEKGNPLYVGLALAVATFGAAVVYVVLKCFCKPNRRVQHLQEWAVDGPGHRADVGLDPSVLETFPVFKYSEVAAHRAGAGPLECSVCLSSFEVDDDGEKLRLLPKCNHVFHVGCVDPWFKDHTTCPLCRTDLEPEYGELTQPDSSQVSDPGSGERVEVNDSNGLDEKGDIEEGHFGKYKRWKSTGHVAEVNWTEDHRWKRFTLKLPDEKMKELGEKNCKFKRDRSCKSI